TTTALLLQGLNVIYLTLRQRDRPGLVVPSLIGRPRGDQRAAAARCLVVPVPNRIPSRFEANRRLVGWSGIRAQVENGVVIGRDGKTILPGDRRIKVTDDLDAVVVPHVRRGRRGVIRA